MNLINIFSKIPELLNLDLTPESAMNVIRKEFEKELDFDFVTVAYLNADSIDIKTISEQTDKIRFVSPENANAHLKNFIKNKVPINKKIVSDEPGILQELGLSLNEDGSVAVLPLMIKDAIFGIIIGIKFANKTISDEEFAVAKAFAGICSYVIKDAELSNVFKLQLKVLNENIIEKTYTIEDVKEQNEKIKEAEKIKTDFLMNMSHSLRTPLNAIIGFAEALQMKVFGELQPKQQEYILDIENSGKEMLGLVNEILDMSKLEAGAMRLVKTETNVSLLIKEAVCIIKSLASKKNITVKTNIPKDDVYIMADGQKLNQILYNLLSNAVKFTNPDGNIEIGLKEFSDVVQFYVKDDGIGIDKKYHGKIFAKFSQIDNNYTSKYASTGLGLTITKEMIEMHDGKIWVESKVNNGTKFTFELPRE